MTRRDVDRFSVDTRNAINQFLAFAEAEHLTRTQTRSQDCARERKELVESLRARDQERWDGVEDPPASTESDAS